MIDEAKRLVAALRARCAEQADCNACPIYEYCIHDGMHTMHNKAADLIESLAAELEQVKQERDGLSIMLTSAMSAAHTFKRKLEEAGRKCVISPLAQGRMNGRHDGYNVLFSAIDEMPEKPCGTCVNRDWDMPQCRECNSINNFRWYVKEA